MWKNIDEKLVIDEETKREAFFFYSSKTTFNPFFRKCIHNFFKFCFVEKQHVMYKTYCVATVTPMLIKHTFIKFINILFNR